MQLSTSFVSSNNGIALHGQFHLGGSSADLSGTGAGRLALSTARYYLLGGVSGHRHNDLRAGGGFDSRNVYRRFFGMDPEAVRNLIGNRQQDSGFQQYGIEGRFAARLRPDQLLSINYQRGVQDRVDGYKDLLGGLGRLISTFEPQELDWFYTRYEKRRLGWLDSINGTFSFNGQTDGGRRQNLSFSDPLTTDFARVNVLGYSGQATTHAGSRLLASFGGEFYDEHIDSTREVRNPTSGVVTRPRPLYPNNSRYQNIGAFSQASYRISPNLSAAGGVRLTGVRFSTVENRAVRIPESSQWFHDVTFQSSVQWQVKGPFSIHGVVSRGFRAPNLNDLGALGLNDLGYEVPAAEAIPAGALLSTDAGEASLSKGTPLKGLSPESLMNYEFGMRVRSRRVYARAQFFDSELYDPIVRRTLLFPAGNVPATLAGLPVTPIAQTPAQRANGVVIQAALGAGRFHLVQGVLIESLLLAIAGGAAGACLAWSGVRVFHQLLPASVPLWMKIEVDWPVLLFCLTVTMLTGLAFGAFPAWIGSRVDLNDALKQGSRGGSQRSAGRGLLVVLEVALSLMLLVGAGLLMKTFLRLQQADHGFTPDNLIVARVNNGHLRKGTRPERAAFLAQYHDRVLSALSAIPGVTSVAATNSLPYSGQEPRKGRLRVKGRADDELRFLLPVAGADVSWSYLQTMGIPLVKGRFFNSSDGSAAAPVVILNETGAKALLGGRDPIGQMVQWGDTAGDVNPYCRVVGVVRDIKQEAVARDTITLYYPHTQWPVGDAHYLLRARMDGKALMPLIRRALQTADPNAAIAWMKPMNERIDEALWQRRLWGVLFSLFAVLAVALAGVGLYGLLSYTVSQSTREIGIRLAIGSSPGNVLAAVAGRGMGLVAAGLLTGAMGALAGSRAIAHLLEGVSPFDVSIYLSVAAMLAGVGAVASLVPALRAARVDPLIALRDE